MSSTDAPARRFHFDNTYARLPERFYSRLNPTPVAAPCLIQINSALAQYLGLDPEALASPAGVEMLAGNHIAEGSEPLAIAYAGHQFGQFVPSLGDGRANLLGEVLARDGKRFDIQLKGSGPTPFSRRGDGRAAVGPVLREYIVSEAMAALGVPTARALAAVLTGEEVYRESIQPGAIFTRVATSHLRVGTFQYFAAQGDLEAIRTLADYAIQRHYPEAADSAQPVCALLDGVIERHAKLVAQWLLLGFIHGVMNTDNMSISGETIDYGPCAFLEAYHPDTVFSSIDHRGRYAYRNQAPAANWNLTRLAECLLPLLEQEAGSEERGMASAQEALAAFEPTFLAAHAEGLRRKLGLQTDREGDVSLAQDLLDRMAANRADFTLTFRNLCDSVVNPEADAQLRKLFADPTAYDEWATRWHERIKQEPHSVEEIAPAMRTVNPAFIPRNHRIQEAIEAAEERRDFVPFQTMLDVISRPYDDRPELQQYRAPARPDERVQRTFCGT
jgi:uncharacterized protein YdiU (UPF0061 family)